MAGSTANMALIGSSTGVDIFNIIGFKYVTDKLNFLGNVFGPTESNQSRDYINNAMHDPLEQPSLDELLDPKFFVKMPYTSKLRVDVRINSVTHGKLCAPDFEAP